MTNLSPFRIPACLLLLLLLLGSAHPAAAQSDPASPNDSVRVSVTLNEDGSRTTYQYDTAHHQATATTTGRDGKMREKIQYVLDESNRFGSGRVFGPDGQFLFRTVYKYDAAGRLLEESRIGKDDHLILKLVYSYDAGGKQTGYAVYDGAGHLLGQTSAPAASATAKPRKGGR